MPLIVTTFPAHAPVTPVGKPVTVAPVAPVVRIRDIRYRRVDTVVCASVPTAEVRVTVLFDVTVIVPVAVIVPQPPVRLTV